MFYSQTILSRRGKFGVLWMEATGVQKQTRRQIFSVNIRKACSDILDYVLVRLPPASEGGKRPRFSLYLSAQLMYGTVRVFGKQHDFLLADAVAFKSRVRLEIATAEEINLAHVTRQDQVTLPDPAAGAGERQPGFDPLFGVWKEWDDTNVCFKQDDWLSSPSASEREELSQLLSPSAPAGVVRPEFGSPHTVSSIEEITIRDEPVSHRPQEVEIPGEKDIPQFDGRELDMLQEESLGDGAMLDLHDLVPEAGSQSSQSDQVVMLPTDGQEEYVLPPIEETPRHRATRKPGERRRKRDQKQQEELDREQAVTPAKTPRIDQIQDLTMELMPVEVSPRHRRHRRQLFVDANIQLSKDDLRQQLATGHTTCGQFLVQTNRPSTPAELFVRPGSRMLENNKVLLRHWKKNLVVGISDTESDKDRPIWSVPELGRERRMARLQRRGSSEEEIVQAAEEEQRAMEDTAPLDIEERREELSSVEFPRAGSISRDLTPTAERSLSRHEISHESTKSLEESHGRLAVELTAERDLPLNQSRADHSLELKVVPEELSGMLSPQVSGVHDLSSDNSDELTPRRRFFRMCERTRGLQQWMTFREVCPTSVRRNQAAICFAALLELCKAEKLFVKQKHPYDEIYISTDRDSLPQ